MKVDFAHTKKAAQRLRAVNHRLRQNMINFIDQKGETDVTSIYQSLKLEQSVASQHLAILRRAGIVTTRRDGKYIFYSVSDKSIKKLIELCKQMITD